MPTIQIAVYLTEKEYWKYLKKKQKINNHVKDYVKKEVKK